MNWMTPREGGYTGGLTGEPGSPPRGPAAAPSRVEVHELRVAAEAVARDFAAVAETLHPAGELAATARRMTELGTTLRTFGELLERHWAQDFTQ